MLIFRLLPVILAVLAAPPGENQEKERRPRFVTFEDIILEVQEAFRRLVTHRSVKLEEKMRQMCKDKEVMMMKVNIVKGPADNASSYENIAHWDGEDCTFHVYDAGVEVLQRWCIEDPHRHLAYKQNESETVVQGKKLAVVTNCELFAVDPDEYNKEVAESVFKLIFIVASVVFVFIFFSWFFRRDVVVVVNNAPEKIKDIDLEILDKKDDWKQKAADRDCYVLLENQ